MDFSQPLSLEGSGASITGLSSLASNSGSLSITGGASLTTNSDFTNTGTLTVGAGSTLTVGGNFTQSSAGSLDVQIGGAPGSGPFSLIAVGGSATLAGTYNLGLVNGYTPQVGQQYSLLSFTSASGNFTSFNGLSPYFSEALTATAQELTVSSSPVDLVTSNVGAPTTATAGQTITVTWQVTNQSNGTVSGSWQDSVYLSSTPGITASSILLGAVPHTGGLNANGQYNGSFDAPVPNLPPGFYYVLVQADSLNQTADTNRANNTEAAGTGQLHVTVPSVTVGTPLNDSFTAADQDHYYQVTVPAGGTLQIALASAGASGEVDLYVSQGTEPTPYSYQYAANVSSQPDQTLNVPVLAAGTYYILAHSVSGEAATSGFTLTIRQTSGLSVSAISNYAGGDYGSTTVEIDGTNFSVSTTATLTQGTTTINDSAVDFVSPSQIYATFPLQDQALGAYTLQVQDGSQTATASTAFHVATATSVPPPEPDYAHAQAIAGDAQTSSVVPLPLSVALNMPQAVRSGRTATFVIAYTNPNNYDIAAPLLTVTSTNPLVSFSTADDPNNFMQSTQLLAIDPAGPAGILRPGQSGQITLTLLSDDIIDGDQLPVNVGVVALGQTINWSSLESSLKPAGFTTAAWNLVFANLVPALGSTTDSYIAALGQAATYLGRLGETSTEISDVSRLFSFLVSQANAAYPTGTLASTVDAALPTPGSVSLSLDRTFVSTIAGRNQSGIFGPGWVMSWQTSLSIDPAGNVSINTGASLAYYSLQPNGTYLGTDGEHATLTLSSGDYTLTDVDGTQTVFLPGGQLNYIQDTNGNRITAGYNSQPQPQLVSLTYSNPADSSEPNEQLTLSYTLGEVTQVTDSTGATWTYSYDSNGQLQSVTSPGNLTTMYGYDSGGPAVNANALTSITNPDGSQTLYTYDSQGRLSATSGNGGANAITYSYPGEAAVTSTDLAGNQTIVWFNDLGLPSRTEDARGGVGSELYNINGNLVQATDPFGNTYQYSYDASGNLAQMVNPLGQSVELSHGPLGELTSYTDAGGSTTQYGYSTAGNLMSITYPDGTTSSFTYDPLGNLAETVHQNGDPIQQQTNAEGLVTLESFADGTSQAFTYDGEGNLLTARTFDASGNLTGTTTLTYNAANELLTVTYPNGQFLHFTYNTLGQRTQSVDQDGYTVNYSYDTLGRLSELTDGSNNLIVQYSYNNLGQLAKKVNGNGTYTTYGYDADGNVTSIVNYAGGTTVNSSFTYTYNLLGEETSVADNAGNITSYGYDPTGQLTLVTLPGGQTITYTYDADGNRTQVVNAGTTTLYASNSDNEITQAGSTAYTYDANGNLHTSTDASGTTTYTYNDLNQLTSITTPDGTTTTFQYSPLGFLTGTTVTTGSGSSQTNYFVDPTGSGNVVGAYNGSGGLIAKFTYGLGLVSQTSPSGTGYYDFDAAGNTVGITNDTGSYVNQYSYLPFGETTTVSAAMPNAFTFGGQFGQVQLAANFFYLRARNYTPATGQFTSSDPAGLNGGDTNTRRYTGNNPVSGTDPRGLSVNYGLAEQYAQVVEQQAYAEAIAQGGYIAAGATEYAQEQYNLAFGYAMGPSGSLQVVLSVLQAWYASHPEGSIVVSIPKDSNHLVPVFLAASPYGGPLPNVFPLTEVSKAIIGVLVAADPNALIGPAGTGPANFISLAGSDSYTVEFENDGTTAAQDVTVTEPLDANLAWSTFQLGSFGFGPIDVTVPAGLTQYQTTVAYQNTDGSALDVKVALDFNVQTGLFTVTFTSLDPLTAQSPTGVFDGFLPPDDSTHVGEGFVQYTIQPKSALTTGTTLNQQASVIFDTNDPLATNTYTNTIDSVAPTSTVNPLPANSLPSFPVSWSGQDDSGGSGIAFYDVYVSTDGGAWQLWQNQTTQTSAIYNGSIGHTYAFYCVAQDNVGNLEVNPPTFEAQTQTADYQTTLTESAGTLKPATEKISTLLTGHYSDPDGSKNTHPGIAILATNGSGTWQYSTNGISWVNIATVSTTSALLLPQADQLRFLPTGLASGTDVAHLLYVAWDGSTGTAGHYVNIGTTGGGSSFSTDAGELDVTLTAVTQAPLWLATSTPLTPVLPATVTNPVGETVQQAFTSVFSGDNGQTPGVAVVGLTGTSLGTWVYNVYNGTAYVGWKAIPTTTTASKALLLSGQDLICFVPKSSSISGPATLLVHAWDGTPSASDGLTVNLSKTGSTGGKTDFSSAILTARLSVNHAPTQNATSVSLPAISENAPSKAVSVATLLKDAGAADQDHNPLGLALTGDSGNGVWQYELAGGVWQNVPSSLSEAAVLLLPNTALLRFDPTVNQSGSATLTWEAWDGTEGTNGTDGFAITGTGGATAFSSTSATATLTVTPAQVALAPAWNGTGATLTPVLPGSTPAGDTVASIFGSYFDDPNVGQVGIAVSGVTGTANGTWEYSTDGTNWVSLNSVKASQAVLLLADDLIRFVPKAGFLGTVTLTAYAWNGTGSGTPNLTLHGKTGGTTAFSSTTLTATCLVNTSPTLEP